jgi:hypothetical protein
MAGSACPAGWPREVVRNEQLPQPTAIAAGCPQLVVRQELGTVRAVRLEI